LQLVTSNLLGTGVGEWPTPKFCDIDADNDQDLFIGNYSGKIWFYRNDGDSANYNFTYVTNYFDSIDVGDYAAPEFADMDGDGDFDLWVGRDAASQYYSNDPGDVFYYENVGTPQAPQFVLQTTNSFTLDAGNSCNAQLVDDDQDGDLDLWYSNVKWLTLYRNEGTATEAIFTFNNGNLLNGTFPHFIALYDLNGDDKYDLISANGSYFNGEITFYENIGTQQSPVFAYWFMVQTSYTLGYVSIADMDADDDGDMVVSTMGVGAVYFMNQGTSQNPNYVLLTENWQDLLHGPTRVADMDLDGDFDALVYNSITGKTWLYENTGTPQAAQLTLIDTSLFGYLVGGACPGDIDADMDVDILVGTPEGGLVFLRNTTGDTSAVQPRLSLDPRHGIQFTIGPNPANPITWISYNLPYPQKAEIAVYNLLGQKVAILASGLQMPGEHRILWNSVGVSSGVYWVRLVAGASPRATTKMVVVVE